MPTAGADELDAVNSAKAQPIGSADSVLDFIITGWYRNIFITELARLTRSGDSLQTRTPCYRTEQDWSVSVLSLCRPQTY